VSKIWRGGCGVGFANSSNRIAFRDDIKAVKWCLEVQMVNGGFAISFVLNGGEKRNCCRQTGPQSH